MQVQKSSGILFFGFLVARSAGRDRKEDPGKEKRNPEISKLNVVPFLGKILKQEIIKSRIPRNRRTTQLNGPRVEKIEIMLKFSLTSTNVGLEFKMLCARLFYEKDETCFPKRRNRLGAKCTAEQLICFLVLVCKHCGALIILFV